MKLGYASGAWQALRSASEHLASIQQASGNSTLNLPLPHGLVLHKPTKLCRGRSLGLERCARGHIRHGRCGFDILWLPVGAKISCAYNHMKWHLCYCWTDDLASCFSGKFAAQARLKIVALSSRHLSDQESLGQSGCSARGGPMAPSCIQGPKNVEGQEQIVLQTVSLSRPRASRDEQLRGHFRHAASIHKGLG